MIECPYCGSRLRCLRSLTLRDEMLRVRRCLGCGRTNYTSETVINYAEGKELYNGIQRERMRERRKVKR